MDGPRIVAPAKFADPMELVVEGPLPQLAAFDQIGREKMFAHPACRETPQTRIDQNLARQGHNQSAFNDPQRKPGRELCRAEMVATPSHQPRLIRRRAARPRRYAGEQHARIETLLPVLNAVVCRHEPAVHHPLAIRQHEFDRNRLAGHHAFGRDAFERRPLQHRVGDPAVDDEGTGHHREHEHQHVRPAQQRAGKNDDHDHEIKLARSRQRDAVPSEAEPPPRGAQRQVAERANHPPQRRTRWPRPTTGPATSAINR